MSPKLAREQIWTIITFCAVAFIFAMIWLIDEVRGTPILGFGLEPIVVLFSSAVPIITLFWPFRPKYRSKRIKATIVVEGAHHKVAEMGEKEHLFIVNISPASDTSVHVYFGDPVVVGGFIADENRFENVKNAAAYTLSVEPATPNRGDVVIVKNRYDNYCLMTFDKIEAKGRDNASHDVWTIRYVINPKGGINFS